jgi:hypothetical protein
VQALFKAVSHLTVREVESRLCHLNHQVTQGKGRRKQLAAAASASASAFAAAFTSTVVLAAFAFAAFALAAFSAGSATAAGTAIYVLQFIAGQITHDHLLKLSFKKKCSTEFRHCT